ncbi:hypothetical protein GIB67_005896 [Kingdonia uniflora]|uniref:Uncharacterized protein n=1 Tax=Kingdonia uniflora TaxID=39325 RepID=A0A7J7MBN4_9MAGN|nr:hypothetical protein GIB67_005896 [Kingdonia uniflora]
MPGTIQVSILELMDLPFSSVSLKVSMGKREYQTSDKGDFSFPLTTLRDKLVVTIYDPEGNEISQTGVETMLVVEKGIWDDLFLLEGGGHLHMKLQFILSEKERNQIREMRESALKKKRVELLANSLRHSEHSAMALVPGSLSFNYEVTDSRKNRVQAEAMSVAGESLKGSSTSDPVSHGNEPLFDPGNIEESPPHGLEQKTSKGKGNSSAVQLSQEPKVFNLTKEKMKTLENVETQSSLNVPIRPKSAPEADPQLQQHSETSDAETVSPGYTNGIEGNSSKIQLSLEPEIFNPAKENERVLEKVQTHLSPIGIPIRPEHTAEALRCELQCSESLVAENIFPTYIDVNEGNSSAIHLPQEPEGFNLTKENEGSSEKIENQLSPSDIFTRPKISPAAEITSPVPAALKEDNARSSMEWSTLGRTPSNVRKMISAFETSLPQGQKPGISPPVDRFQSSRTRTEVHLKGPEDKEGKTEATKKSKLISHIELKSTPIMKPWEANLLKNNKSIRSDQTGSDAQNVFGTSDRKPILQSEVLAKYSGGELGNLSEKIMLNENWKEGKLDEKDNTTLEGLKVQSIQATKTVKNKLALQISNKELNSSPMPNPLEVNLQQSEKAGTREQFDLNAQTVIGTSGSTSNNTSQFDILERYNGAGVAKPGEKGNFKEQHKEYSLIEHVVFLGKLTGSSAAEATTVTREMPDGSVSMDQPLSTRKHILDTALSDLEEADAKEVKMVQPKKYLNLVAEGMNSNENVKLKLHHNIEYFNEPVSLLEELVGPFATEDMALSRGTSGGTNPSCSMQEDQHKYPLNVTEDLGRVYLCDPSNERRRSTDDGYLYESITSLISPDESRTLCVTTGSKQLMDLVGDIDTYAESAQKELSSPVKGVGEVNVHDRSGLNENENTSDKSVKANNESSTIIRISEAFTGQAVKVAVLVALGTLAIATRQRNIRSCKLSHELQENNFVHSSHKMTC